MKQQIIEEQVKYLLTVIKTVQDIVKGEKTNNEKLFGLKVLLTDSFVAKKINNIDKEYGE